MTQRDVSTILQRLERMSRAISLGFDAITGTPRPMVAAALVDTAWEAVALGHELTLIAAYDDIWDDLEGVLGIWRRIETMARQVQIVEPGGVGALHVASEARQTLQEIHEAVEIIDASLLEIVVDPADRQCMGRLQVAIADLESAADRNFMAALPEDAGGRLDSAMAMLTTCAARASRERRLVQARGFS